MTHSHVDAITLLYPQAAEKTFLLREFDETLESYENDISDPIGGSYEVYLNCRDQIEQGIASMLKFIEQTASMHAADRDTRQNRHCPRRGPRRLRTEANHQATSAEAKASPSPISARTPPTPPITLTTPRRWPAASPNTNIDFGILVCTSGVGMSIAANKVPGVRAALVWDEKLAAMARRHNNANVLCLGAKNTQPDQAAAIVDAFSPPRFEGGRHERRVGKIETSGATFDLRLKNVDSGDRLTPSTTNASASRKTSN